MSSKIQNYIEKDIPDNVHFILENKNLLEQAKIGVEVGVLFGLFTAALCKHISDIHMTAVDPWGDVSKMDEAYDHNDNYIEALRRFEPYKNRITVIREESIIAAEQIEDNSVDFVFIDATHTPEAIEKDVYAWLPKIKDTGFISGHDYVSKFGMIPFIDSMSEQKDLYTDMWTCWWIHKKDIIEPFKSYEAPEKGPSQIIG